MYSFLYKYFVLLTFLFLFNSCHNNEFDVDDFMRNYMCNELNSNILDDSCFNVKCSINSKIVYNFFYDYVEHKTLYLGRRPTNQRVEWLYRHISINNTRDLLIEYPDEFYKNIVLLRKEFNTACYIRWFTYYRGLRAYVWPISRFTDTVFTNLSRENIINLFPDFKGVIKNDHIRQINIDYTKYLPMSVEGYDTIMNKPVRKFYENIEFVK